MNLPEECKDCSRHPQGFCTMYKDKEDKQHSRLGGCAGRTNRIIKAEEEFKLNPLKASKRGVKQ